MHSYQLHHLAQCVLIFIYIFSPIFIIKVNFSFLIWCILEWWGKEMQNFHKKEMFFNRKIKSLQVSYYRLPRGGSLTLYRFLGGYIPAPWGGVVIMSRDEGPLKSFPLEIETRDRSSLVGWCVRIGGRCCPELSVFADKLVLCLRLRLLPLLPVVLPWDSERATLLGSRAHISPTELVPDPGQCNIAPSFPDFLISDELADREESFQALAAPGGVLSSFRAYLLQLALC